MAKILNFDPEHIGLPGVYLLPNSNYQKQIYEIQKLNASINEIATPLMVQSVT